MPKFPFKLKLNSGVRDLGAFQRKQIKFAKLIKINVYAGNPVQNEKLCCRGGEAVV